MLTAVYHVLFVMEQTLMLDLILNISTIGLPTFSPRIYFMAARFLEELSKLLLGRPP